MKLKFFFALIFMTVASHIQAQTEDSTILDKDYLDSIYIKQVETGGHPYKVLHAEPLYIDLIRDLGARKGEKEWNVGMGLTDNDNHDRYIALVEYEWAPIDRLGLEVELPFTFYYTSNKTANRPRNKLNSLKLAAQYTFLVSEKRQTSMAIGYLHEFGLTEFANYGKERFYNGNVYNPFFIAAKRWGQNYHTLVYTGPEIFTDLKTKSVHTTWQFNSNIHYMIDGTRNFLGIEFNKEILHDGTFDMTIRPQMRVGIMDNLLIGIVSGIPINRDNDRISSFIRLIYEPGHKVSH